MTGLTPIMNDGRIALLGLFVVTQVLYLASMLLVAYFYSWPVDLVKPEHLSADRTTYPPVLLLYPVLRELEETMRTTFHALDKIDYPRDRYRIVAIPNHDDNATIAALQRLQAVFSWLEILSVPPTSHASWNTVWEAWESNPKAYWWHTGKRSRVRDLPPKKTRQLVYAFYNLCHAGAEDTLISYIDADSAPPPNYFLLGAAGASNYDVVQLTNVAGNVLSSWATSFHGFDHMCWDASMYAHMTAHGKHPFYVLGKGLFFRSSDLHAFGGFHPWLTIEDPEVGMRLWTNGRRLGVVQEPLVEEVPATFRLGVTQRKRWVCGFFQSLSSPLKHMGMTGLQRFRARLNLIPCLSLLVNPIGIAVGIWVLALAISGDRLVDFPLAALAAVNILGMFIILMHNWINAWKVSRLVLRSRRERLWLAFRVNPLFVIAYWLFWSVSIIIGLQMFIRDKGLIWERTEKVDANHDLVRLGEVVGAGSVEVRVLERDTKIERRRDMISTGPDANLRRPTLGPALSRPRRPAASAYGTPIDDSARLNRGGGRHRKGQYHVELHHIPVLTRHEPLWPILNAAESIYRNPSPAYGLSAELMARAVTDHRRSQIAGLEALCSVVEGDMRIARSFVNYADAVPLGAHETRDLEGSEPDPGVSRPADDAAGTSG
jgi:cellulose synthase/poly-beta-1,6-N-acetylglucosamine synthase-like glycosyltransferase